MADFNRIALSALPQLDRFASGLARGFTARAQAEAARRERERERRVSERTAAAKQAREERARLAGMTQDALEDTIQSLSGRSGRSGRRAGGGGGAPAITADTRGDLQKAIVDTWSNEITELLRARGVPESEIADPAERAALIDVYRLPARPLSRHAALAREAFAAQAPQPGGGAPVPGGGLEDAAARRYAGLQAVEPLVRQLAGGAGIRDQFVDEMFPGPRMQFPPEGLQRATAPAFQTPPPPPPPPPPPAAGRGGNDGGVAGLAGNSTWQVIDNLMRSREAPSAPRDLRPVGANAAFAPPPERGPGSQAYQALRSALPGMGGMGFMDAAATQPDSPAQHLAQVAALLEGGGDAVANLDLNVVDRMRPEWPAEKRRQFKAALVRALTADAYGPGDRSQRFAEFVRALQGGSAASGVADG